MIKTKMAFLESRLLSGQSEQSEKLSKQKWLFWRAGFYPANQSNIKSIQKALIGWKKATFVLIM